MPTCVFKRVGEEWIMTTSCHDKPSPGKCHAIPRSRELDEHDQLSANLKMGDKEDTFLNNIRIASGKPELKFQEGDTMTVDCKQNEAAAVLGIEGADGTKIKLMIKGNGNEAPIVTKMG